VSVPAWLLAELEGRARRCLSAEDRSGGAHELAALALEVVARERAGVTPYRSSSPPPGGTTDEQLGLIAALERENAALRARVRALEAMIARRDS
jgi:hypothetical protein